MCLHYLLPMFFLRLCDYDLLRGSDNVLVTLQACEGDVKMLHHNFTITATWAKYLANRPRRLSI